MKKIILLLSIAAVVAIESVSAQSKIFWLDLQVAQNFGLNKWSDIGYVDAGFPSASVTEVRGVFNLTPFRRPVLGFFGDAGLSVMPAPAMKSLNLDNLPMPNSGTRYYLRETVSQSGVDNASVHFRIATGIFGNFQASDKLNVMPYLGIGAFTMSRRSHEMILKEEGSNMQYNAMYVWGVNADEYSTASGAGYVTGRLNFRYKLGAELSLLFGLEYSYFFNTMDFYGRYSNTFNGNVQRSFRVEGKNMNMLGISVGISFR